MSSLSDLLQKVKDARDLILQEAPEYLTRASEFFKTMQEACDMAVSYLNNKIQATATESHATEEAELEKIGDEMRDFGMKSGPMLAKAGLVPKDATIPASVRSLQAKMLCSVIDRLLEEIHDDTSEECSTES